MPCYHPLPARKEYDGRTGKQRVRIVERGGAEIWLPCQKCLGCREMQQQTLAIRMIHESKQYHDKAFLTLTYTDEKLPDGLEKDHLEKFWKRLRYHFPERIIKYLSCGEYGDKTQRPHYHAAVLGLKLTDRKKWDMENDRSPALERVWNNGIVTVSELTEDRIRYVAGYVLKKAGYRKQIYCTPDGEDLEPPYREMSKGLGKTWLKKYASDLRGGALQHDGVKYAIPRYYRNLIQKHHPEIEAQILKEQENVRQKTLEDLETLKTAEKIREQQLREKRRQAKM